MKIKSKDLSAMLKRISTGGIIKECVLITTEQGSSCVAIDLSDSLYTHINSPVTFGLTQNIGISDIATLVKYLNNPENESVDATIQDNRLVFLNNNVNFRYLLSKPEVIPTMPQELSNDDLAEVQSLPYSIALTEVMKKQFLDMATLTKPQFISVKMGTKGRITLEAGTETSNKFDMVLGNCEPTDTPLESVDIRVGGEFLMNVINVLDSTRPAVIRFDGTALVVIQDTDFWVLQHVKDI